MSNTRPPWRVYGYVFGVLMLGVAVGLLSYPSIRYPVMFANGLMLGGILLLAVSAPLWSSKK